MPIAEDTIERGLDLFLQLVEQDAALSEEFRTSVPEFFGEHGPQGDESAHQLAARRHVEWFLLERPSEALADVPVLGLVERWLERAPATEQDALDVLQATLAGIFEVTGVTPGEGVWIRDLAAFGEYPLYEPEGSMALEVGDLLVGRIFPVGDSLYRISRAAAHFRNAELLQALRADLERLRASHRGVMRLAQSELERMFWGGGAGPTAGQAKEPADPVAAAREFLAEAGLGAEEIAAILARLAAEPCPGEQVVPGAGDALGAVLDGLAFETEVDLGRARALLLAAWPELARPRAPAKDAPRARKVDASVDVAAAVAAFDKGRAEGRDLEALFDELERELQLDEEGSGGDEDSVPDFPGVVGAMIEEFVWDVGREQGEAAANDLRILSSLGDYARDIGVFENLRPRDLLAYTTVWAPERGGLDNADDARRLVGALRGFCRWAEERQSLPLLSGFREALRGVESSLPRIVEANRRGGAPCRPGEGTLLEVVSVDGGLRARPAGGAARPVEASHGQREWLRPGDHVLVTDRGDTAVLCRCYPPEAKPILADLEKA